MFKFLKRGDPICGDIDIPPTEGIDADEVVFPPVDEDGVVVCEVLVSVLETDTEGPGTSDPSNTCLKA